MDFLQDLGKDFLSIILPAVMSLLAAYAIYGLNIMISKVKAQTKAIATDEQRVLLYSAIDDVERLTTKTVSTFEQTVAKGIREAIDKGLSSREELQELAEQAFDEIYHALRPEAVEAIEKNYGSFRNYLVKCIETKVLELKQA